MIVLDKNKPNSQLILTLLKAKNNAYSMSLHSPYSNKTYELFLGVNTSYHVDRYDEFIVPLSDYEAFESGRYQYKVIFDDKVVEAGICMITEHADLLDNTIVLSTSETEDDYIVLQN